MSRPYKLLIFVFALGAFPVGCVRYAARPINAEQSAASFIGRTLDDPGLRSFLAQQGAATGPWNVDRLALAATYFHGTLAIARAESEEARAGIKTAGQSPNPVLSFSPTYDTTTPPPWILGGIIDVPIETAGKRAKRLVEARAIADSASLRVAVAAWEARSKVRSALLGLYAAQETSALLSAEVALHQDAVAKLDTQVQAGAAPAFELIQERLGFNRSKLALQDAEKLAATSKAQLAAAVGVPSSALDRVTLDFSAFTTLPATPGPALRRRALTHRADLLVALADYAAADADLRLQVAKQYPDVHLQPGYLLDQTDNKYSLGLSIELPIVNQNKGPIAQADAHRIAVGARFEAKQQAAFGELEVALAGYRAARAKAETASTLASEAEQALATTKRMVELGELIPLELTRRKIETSASSLSRLDARIQAQQSAGLVEAAVQSPLQPAK